MEYVEKYSLEYEVDPLLIYAIIKTESNFKKDAIPSVLTNSGDLSYNLIH